MKTMMYFLSAILAAILMSCANQPEKQGENSDQAIEPHSHREVLPDMKLNNGKKWKVDETTNKSVLRMQQIVELYEIEKNKTLAGYIDIGKRLEMDIARLVEECQMTGPDHDALHGWLHPFMEEVSSLANAQNAEDAENFFEGADAMLHKYHEFFET